MMIMLHNFLLYTFFSFFESIIFYLMEDKNTSISIKIQLISSDGDVVEISRDSVRPCKLIEDIISSSLGI